MTEPADPPRSAPYRSAPSRTAPPPDHVPGRGSRSYRSDLRADRARLRAVTIALVAWVAVAVTFRVDGIVVRRDALAINWQIDSLPNLLANPFTSTWYHHVQPPLHNLFIGLALRWSPFPAVGTLEVLAQLALLATALLLAELLVTLSVPGTVAGLLTALAITNPNLLATIPIASYEVPMALLLLASLRTVVAIIRRPTRRRWILLSGLLTTMALTRNLFHPLWVLGMLTVVVVLRPPTRRTLAIVAAIPLLTIGGWTLKNQLLFGEPTMTTWAGFNLSRGITASVTTDAIDRAIERGDVSTLARRHPWEAVEHYRPWMGDCEPSDRHPSLWETAKPGIGSPNFNHECLLPVYRQAASDARTLAIAEPGRYLRTRWEPLRWSFAMAALGPVHPDADITVDPDGALTWMDRLGDRWLLPIDITTDQRDWNLPLLGRDQLPARLSLTLTIAFFAVVARAVVAGLRLIVLRRRHGIDLDEGSDDLASEAVWFLFGVTAAMVVVGGALVEFGENGRFRAPLDPLLVSLPVGAAIRAVPALGRRLRTGRRVQGSS